MLREARSVIQVSFSAAGAVLVLALMQGLSAFLLVIIREHNQSLSLIWHIAISRAHGRPLDPRISNKVPLSVLISHNLLRQAHARRLILRYGPL